MQCFFSWTKYGRSSRPEGKNFFFQKMSLWHKGTTILIYEMDHQRGELKNIHFAIIFSNLPTPHSQTIFSNEFTITWIPLYGTEKL